MASSGALSTSNDKVKYRIDVTPGNYSIEGNYTPVTVAVVFYRTNTGYKTWGSGTVWCRINGTVYSAGIVPSQYITEAGITLFSASVNIPHNDDGTKTLSVSAWINMNSPLSSGEQGFSFALTTIPRATTPSLSPVSQTMGGSIFISLPRASSNFTHTVSYAFGSASGTIASGAGVSASFSVPLTLANQIPNDASGKGTITVQTYNGSQLIGTKSVEFAAVVPDSVVPVISSVKITDTVANVASKFASLISGKSKLQVVTQAAGAYGSSIQSVKVLYYGNTYTGATVKDIDVVRSGTQTVKVTVRDSRGRETVKDNNITVVDYEAPSILWFKVTRCDESGAEDDEGANLLYTANFSVSPCSNKNDKSYKIEYKKVNETSWKTAVSGSVYAFNSSGTKLGNLFDVDYAYDIRLTVSDYFTSSQPVQASTELPSAFTLFDCYQTGKGFCFGGVADKDGLSLKMPAYMEAPVQFDKGIYVVDEKGRKYDIGAALLRRYDWIYPVGIIVAFAVHVDDPADLFLGTVWERVAEGQVLVGQKGLDSDFGTMGQTGGEKSHTLTLDEMPRHAHSLNIATQGIGNYLNVPESSGQFIGQEARGVSENGGGSPHNNLPPYRVVQYWMRVA